MSQVNFALKNKIIALDKTQVQVAFNIGMDSANFSKIVRGWRKPDEELKKRIAKELKCKVSEIFLGNGN